MKERKSKWISQDLTAQWHLTWDFWLSKWTRGMYPDVFSPCISFFPLKMLGWPAGFLFLSGPLRKQRAIFCTQMFIVALYVIAQSGNNLNVCQLKDSWTKRGYLYNAISFSHKNELRSDTYYNMDEFWKHYAKIKKSVQKTTFVWIHLYGIE